VNAVGTPLADTVGEARRVLDGATAAGIPLRVLGGVAIAMSSPREPLLPRTFNDIDFMTARGAGPRTAKLFEELGYTGDQQFNGLNGHRRLLFYDTQNGRRIDIFVGRFEMCHTWPLERRLEDVTDTLPLGDLLLTKLQIFALTEKDQRDIVSLVHAHKLSEDDSGINIAYVAELCAADWGLWRTATANLERVRGGVGRFELGSPVEELVTSRLDDVRKRIDAEPKTRKWKLRARVGERVQWYEEPEDVG
jgi:putative nucleotidyltransferase-like protein